MTIEMGEIHQIAQRRWALDYSYMPGHQAHVEWDHYPTSEELAAVRDGEPPTLVDGETMQGRRWLFGPFRIFHFKNVGPPRWWLPRVGLRIARDKALEFRVGWNFTALSWSIEFRKDSQ